MSQRKKESERTHTHTHTHTHTEREREKDAYHNRTKDSLKVMWQGTEVSLNPIRCSAHMKNPVSLPTQRIGQSVNWVGPP